MNQYPCGTLDDLDLALMKELEVDARQTFSELAGKLRTSPSTVSRRMQRLQDENILKIGTMIDFPTLGYQIVALICLNVHPGTVDSAVKHLALCTDVKHIIVTAARYDIIAWAFFRNSDEFVNFLSGKLGVIPEVTEVETFIAHKMLKNSIKYLASDECGGQRLETTYTPDALDLALIKALEIQPRETVKTLAMELGVGPVSVSQRLRKLVDEGIIEIVSIPNPLALGYKARGTTLIKTSPGNIYTVANELTRHHNVKTVVIVSGSFNICIYAAFRDIEDTYGFMKNGLSIIPGVIRHETMITMSIPHMSFDLISKQE